jgi:hypothetical protein
VKALDGDAAREPGGASVQTSPLPSIFLAPNMASAAWHAPAPTGTVWKFALGYEPSSIRAGGNATFAWLTSGSAPGVDSAAGRAGLPVVEGYAIVVVQGTSPSVFLSATNGPLAALPGTSATLPTVVSSSWVFGVEISAQEVLVCLVGQQMEIELFDYAVPAGSDVRPRGAFGVTTLLGSSSAKVLAFGESP